MENFPIVIRVILLVVWLFVVPAAAGHCLLGMAKNEVGEGWGNLPFLWVGGQMLLWAGLQVICVPLILWEQSFHMLTILFSCYTVLVVSCGIAVWIRDRKGRNRLHVVIEKKNKKAFPWSGICWGLFAVLLFLQLLLAVTLAYADGDDAYYVAVSNLARSSDTMYQKFPYTWGFTELDIRHGLAPFPIWIAFLSWGSGIRVAAVAHTAVPLALIPMTYAIFFLLGKRLFPEKKEVLPLFLIFMELLMIFGDYSFYTVENFMIARSRQGKAALGSIVIPMLFWLLLLLFECLQQGRKCGKLYWVLLLGTTVTGSLCTTVGALLACMLLGTAGLCGAVCWRNWRILAPLFLCCLPCMIYALIYLKF